MTYDDFLARDAADPLRAMRARFALPDGLVYLNGNSLGALPTATPERMQAVVTREWGEGLIRSWNSHDWIGAAKRVGAKIAPLIGAKADEVLVADSTSVNLYKLLVAGLKVQAGRNVILSEPGNFPTDLYVAEGAAWSVGDAELRTVPADQIVAAIDERVAVVMLTHVHYKTGRMLDMAAITAAAQAKGALVLWDLSHSVGGVPVDLNGCNADLAVGCGYKYLNGGPGAPAFLYVAGRHQAALQSPLSGWMGHAAPFAFDDDYRPAGNIGRFQCGTPSILGLAALESGVDVFGTVDFAALVAKSRALGDACIELVEARCPELELVSPRAAEARGSHVSFRHPAAYGIAQALIAEQVIVDFRAPDVIRLGFAPLYNSFGDLWRAVDVLAAIMAERRYDDPAYRVRNAVT
ncbi:kynureninase [Sphingomonas sp. Leaf407]|uniref:kynureninase n=1 Tax=unclassified Sphingomonas TaxID=196159 RepID=UPI0006FEC01F|nr:MULTISPECIES: kynureninase [unclassified Sphingomonas]KQN36901.1 kynureninase [Sphingomonas sp. Leaf42]KQT30328.1 kynureninase [Sphingomonas sp. Leaf407]